MLSQQPFSFSFFSFPLVEFEKADSRMYVLAQSLLVAWLCRTLCYPMRSPPGSSVHSIFPGKNTRVACHFLLQGIFLTQGLNPHLLSLLHCRRILNHWATWVYEEEQIIRDLSHFVKHLELPLISHHPGTVTGWPSALCWCVGPGFRVRAGCRRHFPWLHFQFLGGGVSSKLLGDQAGDDQGGLNMVSLSTGPLPGGPRLEPRCRVPQAACRAPSSFQTQR